MKRFSVTACLFAVAAFAVLLPQFSYGAPDEPFKWYGLGGELTGNPSEPRRWLGRLGITNQIGGEAIFAMEHSSYTCEGHDCDRTRVDIGAGVIYDVAPAAMISPYFAGRFILTMIGNSEDETSGTVEGAYGIEYVIAKRLGLSGELNFSVRTDPSQILTSTRVRFYFYF